MASGTRSIVGPRYDAIWFLASPLWALVVGALVSTTTNQAVQLWGTSDTVHALALRTVIHAHIFVVFARSHLHRAVFVRHPGRFIVVPLVALAALIASPALLSLSLGVVVTWDLVHSSLQTFGLARIYEARAGGDAHARRSVDLALNLALYLGPFLCGPLYAFVVRTALSAPSLVWPELGGVMDAAVRAADVVRLVAGSASVVAVLVYLVTHVQAARAGAPIAWRKHVLHTTTAIACIAAWSLDAFGQALLIVNVFHAAQYVALVAATEKSNLARVFGFAGAHEASLAAVLLVLVGALYGFWVGAIWPVWAPPGAWRDVGLAVVNLIALLHFWYDGFIWSVRRGHA